MPDNLVIRCERPDQPDVMALLAELDRYLLTLYAPDANHIPGVQQLLAPEIGFFVARSGTRAVATGAFRLLPAEDGSQPAGEVKRMYVDPAFRGCRIGAQMLSAIEAALREQGCSLVMPETGRDQRAAVRLYEASGYTQRAPFSGYPDNGLSVFYGKRL